MKIQFDKMEGAGNDFILIDNRSGDLPEHVKRSLVTDYCRRAQGIGADGMIFIQSDTKYDFAWDFFNSDGSRAEMCGNGARCAAKFAHKIGAAGREMTFRTLAGPINATLTERGAKIHLPNVETPEATIAIDVMGEKIDLWFLNTGVPHAVTEVSDIEAVDVVALGSAIRRHPRFAPEGTNANFLFRSGAGKLFIRTYERGVEGETLACGTGSVAAGLIAGSFFAQESPATVVTRSGEELNIYFTLKDRLATSVHLEGGARLVFSGWLELSEF